MNYLIMIRTKIDTRKHECKKVFTQVIPAKKEEQIGRFKTNKQIKII